MVAVSRVWSPESHHRHLTAVFASILAGCGPAVDPEAGGSDSNGGSSTGDTDTSPGSTGSTSGTTTPPTPASTTSDTTPPAGLCGSSQSRSAYYQRVDDYLQSQESLDLACDGGTSGDGWPGSESGGDTTSGSGSSSGTGTGGGDSSSVGWDDVDLTCDGLCAAMLCGVADSEAAESVWQGMCEFSEVDAEGGIGMTCCYTISQTGGRGHACIEPLRRAGPDQDLAGVLAHAYFSEAASVLAFDRLVQELGELGCPEGLLRRIRKASEDEARHARIVRSLCEQRGGVPPEPEERPVALRSILELAIENAAEGCVTETAAALIAFHQGEHAADANVAAAMRSIAPDELRHAALAWDLHDWLMARLSTAERAQVHVAMQESADTLRVRAQALRAGAITEALGLPSPADYGVMLGQLSSGLWAERMPTTPSPGRARSEA